MKSRRKNPKKYDLPYILEDEEEVASFEQFRRSRILKLVIISLAVIVPLYVLYVKRYVPQTTCPFDDQVLTIPKDLPRYHGPPVEFPNRYTLVLNSYRRHKLLQRAISHYSTCSRIDAIRVVWCEDGLPPTRKDDPDFYSEHKEVRYDIMPNSSLNNRFCPLEGLRTEAVLSIDDDIMAPCHELQRAFQMWKQHPRNMVGFYPRLHAMGADCRYRYRLGFGTLTWSGEYSMVLTKAAFMHRDYLEMYTNHQPKKIREYVDKVRNCEDIAMSFLVANATGEAPQFVHSSLVIDKGKGLFKVPGISSSMRHQQSRGECVEEFTKHYGGALPLVTRSISEHEHSWALRITPITDAMVAMLHGSF